MGPVALSAASGAPQYVCGHSATEFARLDQQDRIYRDFTRQMLERAGISLGMRVLDLGCGGGGVSLLSARMVGESGSVVGVDRAAEAIETARRRASAQGLRNVEFVQSEIDGLELDRSFDAIVGRFVLMHQSSPANTLRKAMRHLDGRRRVAFLESDLIATLAIAVVIGSPACKQVLRFMMDMIEAAGARIDLGLRMQEVFGEAGVPHPAVSLYAPMQAGPQGELIPYLLDSLKSIGASAKALGREPLSESELSDLARRLEQASIEPGPILAPVTVSAVFVDE